MTSNQKIGLALIVAGGLFVAYKKGIFTSIIQKITPKDISTKQADEQIKNQLVADAKAKAASTTNIEDPNSTKARIATIQMDLGTTPDGIVGPNTLMALKAKYPLVAEKGLTPALIVQLSDWIRNGKPNFVFTV